jgi:hypothetical protein
MAVVGWEGWGCWLAEQLDEARLAVRVVAMLLEGALVEQFEAERTREVFRVPLSTHRRYTLAWREGEERRRESTVVLTSLRTPPRERTPL